MREILFRGKRKDNEDWAEGCLLHDSEQNESYIAECFEARAAYIREVIPETVGQFTGLTANGKKIFEGDIAKHHFGYEYGVVKFGEYSQPFNDDKFTKHIGFYVDWVVGKAKDILRKDLGYWTNIKECDVFIGNIHDNPELLGNPELMKGGAEE